MFPPGDAVAAALRRGMEEALRHAAPDLHAQVPDSCWRAGWWAHWQPAGTGANVARYLARYVGRTAISDGRIVAADDASVTFRYRVNGSADVAGTEARTPEQKECTLAADEFMRRYLQHVPPPGQHRVRYFGWLHPSAKARRLKVETLLAVVIVVREKAAEPPPWHLRKHKPHKARLTGRRYSWACSTRVVCRLRGTQLSGLGFFWIIEN